MGRICRVVPKQWIRYEPIGDVITNTRFIVFKTPLNDRLDSRLPKQKRFNVSHLLRSMAERGVQLGLVIDLTDTDRYYDHRDIEEMCIDYEKINSPGRGFVERDDLVKTFCDIVENFINANAENDMLIGVHCTHGVNRSGYLICRYLIDQLGWSSHDAIDAFERARGYPIERGAYVQALHRAAKEHRMKKRYKADDEVISSGESTEMQIQRQNAQIGTQSQSPLQSQSQLRKRNKHKRKHKVEVDENGTSVNTVDMEAVWNQMAALFEQHQSLILEGENGTKHGPEMSHVEVQQPPPPLQSGSSLLLPVDVGSPLIGSTGTVEQMEDEEEDADGSAEQDDGGIGGDGVVEGVVEQELSISKKRRARRQRLRKEFELMKTGNFWKINEMQKEKFKSK